MKDKNIAITGTTSGIGKAIAQIFDEDNWDVFHINRDTCDLSNIRDIKRLQLPEYLFAFVNNAGVMPLVEFEDTSIDHWDTIMNVNLRAPFFLAQKVIPRLVPGGHLLNIASVSGEYPESDLMAYGMSKAALIYLTKALAKLYGDKARINALCPGFVKTNITEEPTPEYLLRAIPAKREAQPVEIAKMARTIIATDYMCGSVIRLDGGLVARHDGP